VETEKVNQGALGEWGEAELAERNEIWWNRVIIFICQGSEGPWCTTVLRDGSRVAKRMSICPSAYETSHDVTPVVNRGGRCADGCTLLGDTGIVQEKVLWTGESTANGQEAVLREKREGGKH
jgi:hypothetical protein